MELMHASRQWASRPADERFLNLFDMQTALRHTRQLSREVTTSTKAIGFRPHDDHTGLDLVSKAGHAYTPTHWAFGQLSVIANAPAGYLRTLPSELAADCLNLGLLRNPEREIGVLLQKNGDAYARCATGAKYGRIWNEDICTALIDHYGDGRTGRFTVPGEFGHKVEITEENTTLYAGDRDMFVFLADEENRIEMPNRRDGQNGSLARGFFVWNSEVGSATFGIASFLFDYACCNRIVWGAQEFKQVKLRHTSGAPERFLSEIQPALATYANSSTKSISDTIEAARVKKLGDDVDEFIAKRFGKRLVETFKTIHALEEDRPIETLWDVTTAATAYARNVKWQDDRVAIEKTAGDILDLVAA